ncbi:ArsR/SmtB family transcription factor [Gordonia aichiensis]|uniref:Putative ArsR family transcriptional regulator n=1 Tax=Gordonia aichiensis NBRC 108223 TaxID=1220583 RepID=L7KNW3_9ACTN|nr:metalloregulator ArsR/SmtB family transcription factor [Gordonia aichiensis]GAC50319.1 putative ArsR family transcriptional regulator [Gordonia aichiensis NBRC 108223]
MKQAATPAPSLEHRVSPDPELLSTATALFTMLSDPTRLHILWLLRDDERDVTALTDAVGASRTAVSQHLAKLRFTGLVDTRREGRRIIYRLRDGHVGRVIAEALSHADHRVSGEPEHR